jgi:ribosomal protein L35
MLKTNKSFTKRLKLTKNGKVKRRASGHSHFNAKESNSDKMAKKKTLDFKLTAKVRATFLPKK